jgi:hypothetical protein
MTRDYTPFVRGIVNAPAPMRASPVHKARRARGEIRERTVTAFNALEWLVFVDGSLIEGQMFDGARLDRYQPDLDIRVAQFSGGGWVGDLEVPDNANVL